MQARNMGENRRRRILEMLREAERPITGAELAGRLQVSRQIIVQDMALLRARGEGIIATPQGYILPGAAERPVHTSVLACRHDPSETEEELNLLVDYGVKVIDVIVEHPIYGELRGLLMLESRSDVRSFMVRLADTEASLLSSLTKGVHLHTVQASRQSALEQAVEALRARGLLVVD